MSNEMPNLSEAQTELDAKKLMRLYLIDESDLERVRKLGALALKKIDHLLRLFYDWVESQPEFDQFFSDREKLLHVQELQREHWEDFFRAEIDQAKVANLQRLGEVHAQIGLPLQSYFAGMNNAMNIFAKEVIAEMPEAEREPTLRSLCQMLNMETGLVSAMYVQCTGKTVLAQSKSLMSMSTPVTEIWDGILMLPLVGIIDSKRAQDTMSAILMKISETQSKSMILDISGVAVVDTGVANHLIKITKATRLMGCECTISGVSPAIAQTVVELGIQVGEVKTTSTLRDALRSAFQTTGIQLTTLD